MAGIIKKEWNILFKDALNTFLILLYGMDSMIYHQMQFVAGVPIFTLSVTGYNILTKGFLLALSYLKTTATLKQRLS